MKNSYKVFGIGLSRTGTKSLTAALNMLGLNIIHYPTDAATVQNVRSLNANFHLLYQYDGITDLTVVPFYPQLDQLFPQSKFILTIRHPEDWLRSLEQHWEYAEHQYQTADHPANWSLTLEATRLLKIAVFGRYDFHPDHMLAIYRQHCSDVLRYFQAHPQKLLIINICAGEGWDKLCPFLECETLSQPFPYIEFHPSIATRCSPANV
ncbi:MAG: sulfotransferase family protein [Leptolyngbyaceae cyanobacterium]